MHPNTGLNLFEVNQKNFSKINLLLYSQGGAILSHTCCILGIEFKALAQISTLSTTTIHNRTHMYYICSYKAYKKNKSTDHNQQENVIL